MRLRQAGLFLCLIIVAQHTIAAGADPKLKELYEQKRFFELRDALAAIRSADDADLLFYRGAVSNKFNQLRRSINYLKRYIQLAERSSERSLLKESYKLLADNYLKTYQYRHAASAYRALLTNFKSELPQPASYENSLRLWNALAGVPPQTAVFRGASRIKSFKDPLDLTNIPLEINGQPLSAALDTGANLSIVTASYAQKAKLQLINAAIEVGGITGTKTKANLGIARTMKIGNVTLRHVVFLVVEDQALYISPVPYQLQGIIGFPVIAALGEITFVRDGEIVIPARAATGGAQNMCIADLNPVIEGEFKGKRLSFLLDTGANKSDLYPLFYQAYEKEIKAQYPLQSTKMAGLGNTTSVPAYRAQNLALTFNGQRALFSEITILTEYSTEDSRYFYGNLGQDLIKQFERMTINFRAMRVTFE